MKLIQLIAVIFVISCVSGVKMRQKPVKASNDRPRSFQSWDDWADDRCYNEPELWKFEAEQCDQYYECSEDGWAEIITCPSGEIFDFEFLDCYPDGICWSDGSGSDDDCPSNSDGWTLVGDTCDTYYICINGNPVEFRCRTGQHWNADREYCDNPRTAGCNVSYKFRNVRKL